MLKFLVRQQKIEILEREIIASDQIAFVTLKFTFDGDWKKFHKVVQFTQCDETYNRVLGTDGLSCLLPVEIHAGAVKMSVFGYDAENTEGLRATTVPVTLNIRQSGFVGDDDNSPIPPTPDLYTQLLQKIKEKGKDGKFKAKVQSYMSSGSSAPATTLLYRVRKTWTDAKSQIGAYSSLENAKKACKAGYSVFDNSGKAVYSVVKSYAKGTKVTLNNTTLYSSSTAKTGTKKSGTYYLYDGQVVNNRMRITNSVSNCGKTPAGSYVTGWVNKADI